MAEYEATQVQEEEEKKDLCLMEGVEEVVEEADEGDLLVLRRTFSGLKGSQDEQRENIFHSRCTIKGKVCSLIIDTILKYDGKAPTQRHSSPSLVHNSMVKPR